MNILSYIEPVGAALSIAKNIFSPRPKAAPQPAAPKVDFRAELNKRLTAAEKSAQTTLQQFDANGDGYLSRAELALSREAFARFDLNADGRLDVAELTRAHVRGQE